jgi:hypothetical protein
MLSVEAKLNAALDQIKHQEAEIASLKNEVSNNRIDAAHYERELRMVNAGLPREAKDRLHRAFEHSRDNAGLKQAINTEKRRYTNENSDIRCERGR